MRSSPTVCHALAGLGLAFFTVPPGSAAAPSQEARARSGSSLTAEAARHGLGVRLRALERAYERADPRHRRQGLDAVEAAVQAFFGGRLGPAGQALDDARRAMEGGPDSSHWAEGLAVLPTRRLLETSEESLVLAFAPLYGEAPQGPKRLGWTWAARSEPPAEFARTQAAPEGAHWVELPAGALGLDLALGPQPEGDRRLRLFLAREEGAEVLERSLALSYVDGGGPRLDSLRAGLAALGERGGPDPGTALESESARGLAERLSDLAGGLAPETEVPAARLLAEAEALLAAARAGEPRLGPAAPGDHWLRLPLGEDRRSAARLFVPAGLDPQRPVPLVVALHGAGGSENLFFDGHGDGKAVRLAAERGWLLVAPRLGLFGSGAIGEWVEALAERFPVDRARVFLVGHSMGAAAGLGEVVRRPDTYAALAALGGGSAPRDPAPLAALPLFIAPGERDFARVSARRLYEAVERAGSESVHYRSVPDSEHLLVVQAVLDEVFAFFDRIGG